MKIKLDKRTIFELVLIGIIVILIAFIAISKAVSKKDDVKIFYYTPNGEYTSGPYERGSLVKIEDAAEIEGYTFAGWKDADGNMLSRDEIYVNDNTYLSAVYSVSFNTEDHMVFIPNDKGVFRPDDAMTRSEAAEMLYTLMDLNAVGSGEFEDVEDTDDYYKACATLKDLGIFTGKYFHPDDEITYKEFADTLKLFDVDYLVFMEDINSDESITRAEVAKIMCQILGRTGDGNDNREMVGTFLDVSPNRDDFWYIAESTIKHQFEKNDNSETWTTCKAFDKYEPGFFFVGTALHYIDKNGDPVIDGEAEGLYFNSRGEESSGDAEVDKMVQKLLKEIIEPSKMEQKEMLRAIFDYMTKDEHFTYQVRNYYDTGDTSWVVDEARVMLKTKRGNCYNFAAVFYEMARAIGYDAKIYSGTMGTDYRPHSWVEIDKNGEPMLFDPEYQYAHPDTNMYQRDSEFMNRYHYDYDGAPAQTNDKASLKIEETDKGKS